MDRILLTPRLIKLLRDKPVVDQILVGPAPARLLILAAEAAEKSARKRRSSTGKKHKLERHGAPGRTK